MSSYVHHNVKKYFEPMTNHLASKYPYLDSNKSLIVQIFDYWFTHSYPCRNISTMVKICVGNKDQWDKDFKKEFLKQSCIGKRYLFILNFKPENCHSAILAAEFYGENFDTFVNLCTNVVKFTKIQQQLSSHPDLCDKLINFIKCYIMLIMGHLFYYLSIGSKINDLHVHNIDSLTMGIVKQIEKDNTKFSYKKFYRDNKSMMLTLSRSSWNNEDEDFDDYMKKTLREIWDKYQKTITNFKKMNEEQSRDKTNRIPEFFFVTHYGYPLQKKIPFPKNNIILSGFLVYTMSFENKNEKSPKEIINVEELYPRITKLPEMYLVIEV